MKYRIEESDELKYRTDDGRIVDLVGAARYLADNYSFRDYLKAFAEEFPEYGDEIEAEWVIEWVYRYAIQNAATRRLNIQSLKYELFKMRLKDVYPVVGTKFMGVECIEGERFIEESPSKKPSKTKPKIKRRYRP